MMQEFEREIPGRWADFDRQAGEWMAAYRKGGRRIYCGRGCAGCCTLAVHATAAEAVLLARSLEEGLLDPLEAYVGRLREGLCGIADLKGYLRLHRRQIAPCPFLGPTGACAVYPLRPFSCRSLLSTRDGAWCGIDPADLHPLEKEAFRSSLDPKIVAYPTHYVAALSDLGRQFETDLLTEMGLRWGFSLSGNLPLLVWLARRAGLGEALAGGPDAVGELLRRCGFDNPLLLNLSPSF